MSKSLTILDSFVDKNDSDGAIYIWEGYSESSSRKSILKFADQHGDELREKYLAFVYELGESRHQDLKLREHLQVNDGPSLWWMSLLAEKSPYKSPRIIDCIRLLALEKIIEIESPSQIFLFLDDKELALVIKDLCHQYRISFFWKPRRKNSLQRIFSNYKAFYIYNQFKGLIYLSYYFVSRWGFRDGSNEKKSFNKNSIFFSSYFYNLDLNLADKGEYYPNQWGELPRYLMKRGETVNHLANYIKSPQISNPKVVKELLKLFNDNSDSATHCVLDHHLSLKLLFKVLISYLKISFKFLRFKHINKVFNVSDSELSFWPILRGDWYCSIFGKTLVSNLIWIELFENYFKELPYQKLGFYLCENIGWELALIKAWENNNHGTLIGVPHTTLRFWDLRYFFDPRINKDSKTYTLPTPDYYALNGKICWEYFSKNGYLESKLLKSEALRYQHLNKRKRCTIKRELSRHHNNEEIKRVLIVGDFSKERTDQMLKALESSVESHGFLGSFEIKPHPAARIDISGYPVLDLTETNRPLEDIVEQSDLVFTSMTTTGALECFLMDKNVVIYLDGNDLNMSPLRGFEGVTFVSDPEQLCAALESSNLLDVSREVSDFFWVDLDMPKWGKIISKLKNR